MADKLNELYDRRAEDKTNEARLQAELDTLVAAENDPEKRATLMVLTMINRSLVSNTSMTHEVNQGLTGLKTDFNKHVESFSLHAKVEEALLNKGRGAWMVLAAFLGVVQIVIGYVIVDTRDTMRQNETNTHLAQMADQKIINRIELLEAQKP